MHDQTAQLIGYHSELVSLKKDIDRAAEKDIGNVWAVQNQIVRFAAIVLNLSMHYHIYLKRFFESTDSVLNIFSNDRDKQRNLISKGVTQWYHRFKEFSDEFVKVLFIDCTYYFTYDSFSEHSRDNNRKAAVLASLFTQQSHLLEIGPGTGPLMSRLIKQGYSVQGIEWNDGKEPGEGGMINQCRRVHPEVEQFVKQGDFFEYPFHPASFDGIFVESGILLFTKKLGGKLILEMFCDNPEQGHAYAKAALERAYALLVPGGKFLIGIQRLMKKVPVAHGLVFSLKRKEHHNYVERTITYTLDEGILKKRVLFTTTHKKATMQYAEFMNLAEAVGFKKSKHPKEWILLTK
tara:strand:+ start:401 stop:1447 length:1047 start_codon:yes stop_codon:yes gene_type:complete